MSEGEPHDWEDAKLRLRARSETHWMSAYCLPGTVCFNSLTFFLLILESFHPRIMSTTFFCNLVDGTLHVQLRFPACLGSYPPYTSCRQLAPSLNSLSILFLPCVIIGNLWDLNSQLSVEIREMEREVLAAVSNPERGKHQNDVSVI